MLGTIFGYDVGAILAFVVAWLVGSILAYRFIFIPIVLPWIQKCLRNVIIRIFTKPDDEEKEALYGLLDMVINYMGTRQINTGEKVRVQRETKAVDAEGKPVMETIEIDEIMTPIQLFARDIGSFAVMKIKGQSGGVKAQLNRVLQDGLTGDGGLPLSPAALKALNKGNYGPALTETLLPEIMKRLSKGKGDTSSGSDWLKQA